MIVVLGRSGTAYRATERSALYAFLRLVVQVTVKRGGGTDVEHGRVIVAFDRRRPGG